MVEATPKIEFLDPKIEDLKAIGTRIGETILDSGIIIKQIIPISRGGLPHAFLMSRLLNIKDVQNLCSDLYVDNPDPDGPPEIPLDEPVIIREPILLNEDGSEALVVDDVIDSGKTARAVRKKYPGATIMAMYSKLPYRETRELVDFYGKYVPPHVWIRFPFEIPALERN